MTPYYDEGGITIYHGDCLDVLPTLGLFDLAITSPPYNLGTTNGGPSGMHAGSLAARDLLGYDNYDDAMPQHEYNAWQTEVVAALWATMADNGAIFYNHKPRVQGGVVVLPTDYGADLPLRQVIIWNRETGMNFSERFFLPKCEWILCWAKPGFRLRDKQASSVGDVWTFPPEMSSAHPAAFPVGLPARVLAATIARSVLDPFCGSGTTLVAAKAAGRRAIGIELSEAYCEIAAKRLAQGSLFEPSL